MELRVTEIRNMVHWYGDPLRELPYQHTMTNLLNKHLHRTLRVLAFILRNFQGTRYAGECFDKYFVFMQCVRLPIAASCNRNRASTL